MSSAGIERGRVAGWRESAASSRAAAISLTPRLSLPGRLQVLMVDVEKGAIVVKGSLPGKPGNLLEIAPAKFVGKNV